MYYSAYLPLNFSIGRLCFIVQSIVKKRLFIAFIAKLLTDCSFDYNYSQKTDPINEGFVFWNLFARNNYNGNR